MDCAVVYSEVALSDLHEITAYIADDNAEAAEVFGNRLVDLAESLRRLPERGRPVKRWADVRVIVLSPYLIFYRFAPSEKRVEGSAFLAWCSRSADAGGLKTTANFSPVAH